MEFRNLSENEILALAKKSGIDYNKRHDVSISEFFNQKNKINQKTKFGFR